MWNIWFERSNPTFNNKRWDGKKTQQLIWQSLLEYVGIAWDTTCKEAVKATTYDDVIGKYSHVQGGNELLYHRDNTRTMYWNIKVLNIGLVNPSNFVGEVTPKLVVGPTWEWTFHYLTMRWGAYNKDQRLA